MTERLITTDPPDCASIELQWPPSSSPASTSSHRQPCTIYVQQRTTSSMSMHTSDETVHHEEKKLESDGPEHALQVLDTSHEGTCVTDWLGPSEEQSLTTNNNKSVSTPQQQDDDTDSTTSNTAYFAPSDFDSTSWRAQVQDTMDAPTFGFAVIALAAAITHPLFFIVGALTAFGASHAAGAGYKYYKGEEEEESTNDKDTTNTTSTNSSWIHCWNASIDQVPCFHVATITDSKDAAEQIIHPQANDEQGPIGASILGHSPRAETPDSQQPSDPIQHDANRVSNELWLQQHYPHFETIVVENEQFVGLNVIEFFNVYYADDAPYNFQECQKKRGDIDIHYGPWQDLSIENMPSASLSLHPNAQHAVDWRHVPYESFRGRDISFKAKTHSFLGPPYASTTKTQRYLVLSKRLAVLESKTTLGDIPFCDRFCVMERWIIRAEKGDDRYTSSVSASCDVVFSKACPFEQQIKSKTWTTLADVSHAWCTMAQEALKLAEQAKWDRLRDEYEFMDDDDDQQGHAVEAIEVDYVPIVRVDSAPQLGRRISKSLRRSLSSLYSTKRPTSFEESSPQHGEDAMVVFKSPTSPV